MTKLEEELTQPVMDTITVGMMSFLIFGAKRELLHR